MADNTQSDDVIFSIKIDDTNAEQHAKRMITTIQGLTEANRKLRDQRNKTNLETKEGIEQIKKLNEQINKNNEIIKANISQLEKQRLNIGNYKKEIQEALKEAGPFGATINQHIDSFTKLANPLTVAVAGIGALGAIYLKSAKGADDFARAQNNLNALVDELANDIGADGNGGFFDKLSKQLSVAAVSLSESLKSGGKDFEKNRQRRLDSLAIARIELDTLRDLEEEEIKVAAIRKDTEKLAEDARRIRDDATNTEKERLEAIATVEAKLKENESARVGVINSQIKALISYGENVGSIEEGTFRTYLTEKKINFEAITSRDLRIQLRKLLAEEADIHEEINGKLTENVAAERQMTAEKTAQLKADREADRLAAVKRDAQELANEEREIALKKLSDLKTFTTAEVKVRTDAATSMGKTQEKINKMVLLGQQKTNAMRLDAERNMYGALAGLLSAFGQHNKTAAVGAALVNTYLGVTEILKAPAVPFIEPMASITRGLEIATVIATGFNAIRNINRAAGGGKFVTKGPTMLMVGDNPGGVERVTVEPISGRGKTKVSGNLVQMAGGGVLETTPANYIETSIAAQRIRAEQTSLAIVETLARNLPRQVLVVEDVTKLQNQQVEIRQAATL
jgi:hypothetical protein